MPRFLQLLIGPELLWAFYYLLVVVTIKVSGSPVKTMDNFWERLAFLVPLVAVPLVFGLYWVPGVERNWLLLRIWIAGLIGAHYVLEKGLGAYTEQGPGTGTAYIMGIIFVFFVLIAGSVFVKIKF